MIQQLSIKNFKSIKGLKFPCKKLNVFIGEPNSGKSNIIEALALRSQNAVMMELNKQMFRYKTIGDLFYDFNINKPIEVITEDISTILKYAVSENGGINNQFSLIVDSRFNINPLIISSDGKKNGGTSINPSNINVHLYEYKRLAAFSDVYSPNLSAPYGENLAILLRSNSEYKDWVKDFLKEKKLTLTIKPTENEILASKLINDEIYSYPYSSLSETLQRIIFYTIAIKSNKDSTILFDEPETNTFPLYTKLLAETIALDESNQFFVTTHNPYLLQNLIEKSKISDLNVCIVEMKDYQTKLSVLNEDQISQVLDLNSDVFFNFDKILAK